MRTSSLVFALLFAVCLTASADDDTGSSLTTAEADEVVAEHNRIRKEAGVEVEVAWDAELAQVAQEWADHLAENDMLEHRPESMYGENIAWSSAGPFSGVDAVQAWESEKEHYHGEAIDAENFATFGHYTQVIWDRTTHVGCGRAVSATGGVYIVCNYSPAGNMLGERPITMAEEGENDDPQ
jgi:pathogenesis-related protein 1